MESSTTVPMTKTNANNVRRLTENPATFIKAKVPISDTMMPTAGISVARKSCRKKSTTTSTSTMAMMSVSITSRMEAKRKSLVLSKVTNLMSLGSVFSISASSLSISRFIFVALEPAIWLTEPITPGCPLILLM